MVAMVSDAEATLDQVGHTLRRPQFGGVPPSPRPLGQLLLQLQELLARQLGRTSGASRFPQPGHAFPFELRPPTTDRLAMYPHAAGDLGGPQAALEQAGRPQPPLFQGGEIALSRGFGFHARRVTQDMAFVTLFCRIQ